MKNTFKHRLYIKNARNLRANMTLAEHALWNKIRRKQLGVKFLRQYIIDNLYIVDFICPERKLIIELDGGQHCENINDIARDKYLKDKGFNILRFWNNDISNNIESCIEIIKQNLK